MTADDEEKSADEAEEDSSDDDSEEDNDLPVVESLVAGRAKRATAGNRLSSLLDQEADDELELLFAEDEEDIEFDVADEEDGAEAEAEADERFESSDDDDADQGPPADGEAEEDLEGEKELQRQARAERQAKKRKAQDTFFRPPAFRKRVKIDPTTPSKGPVTPATKPKRRIDRISSADGPTRSSSRKATVQNKEVVHARIKEQEKRRLQMIAVMEAAAKRKGKPKPKVLTQADRMAEAERTESLNSKSLNRWEETEKKRSEEQKARLAALQNRRLEGPVITWWSGLAEWVNGKLERVGRKNKDDDGRTPKRADDGEAIQGDVSSPAKSKVGSTQRQQDSTSQSHTETPADSDLTASTSNIPTTTGGFLDGIHYYASLPSQQPSTQPQPQPQPSPSTALPIHPAPPPQAPHPPAETTQDPTPSQITAQPQQPPDSSKPESSYSTHNLLILTNFDQSTSTTNKDTKHAHALEKAKKELSFLLNPTTTSNKRQRNQNNKTPKAPLQEPCVITLQPARYRDPSTGLAYLDSNAYKEIQRLKAGGCQWSSLLGCYVGPVDGVARGVPERFFAFSGGGGGAGR